MLLKTYKAADLATALARARAELGSGALVLATRESVGRLGLPIVEVTVASERPDRSAGGRRDPVVEKLMAEIRAMRRRLDSGSDATVVSSGAANTPADELTPALRATARALVASGLSEDLVRRFARIASRAPLGLSDPNTVARATEEGVAALLKFEALPRTPDHLLVVGPCGCGKTSTTVKLAARITTTERRRVHIAQAHPGSHDGLTEMSVRSAGPGVTVARIPDTSALRDLRSRTGPDCTILFDTPGVAENESERLAQLNRIRQETGAGVLLLLPNGLHRLEAERVLRRFEPLSPRWIGFSRTDDGRRPGDLVTAVAEAELPLSLITNGRGLHHIQDASPRGLAKLMLQAALSKPRQEVVG